MIEKITSLEELQKKYEAIPFRKPVKGDLVYVASIQAVCTVIHVEGTVVRVESGPQGSGLTMTLPPSYYKLVETKKKSKK